MTRKTPAIIAHKAIATSRVGIALEVLRVDVLRQLGLRHHPIAKPELLQLRMGLNGS
jgi:hypothetical protein